MSAQVLEYGHRQPWRSWFFRRRWKIALLVAVFVLAVSILLPNTGVRDTALWMDVPFRVTDAQTGASIPNAKVNIMDGDPQLRGDGGTTDGGGVCTLRILVPARRTSGLLSTTVRFGRSDNVILVRAPGYVDEGVTIGTGTVRTVLGIGGEPKLRVDVRLKPVTRATPSEGLE